MKLKAIYDLAIQQLDEEGIETSAVDAFWLLSYVTGLDRAAYLMSKERELKPEICAEYMELIRRRAAHEPCQYIIGSTEFMGLEFKVSPDVLIPRQDTEVLAEETIRLIGDEPKDVLDMCTGSGCLAVAIKHFCPEAHVSASDISPAALEIAGQNAAENGKEIEFAEGDLFGAFGEWRVFDFIVSNPPYVTEEEYAGLMPEVREFEPKLALTAGAEGLDVYERLISEAPGHLRDGGTLLLEIGCSQAGAVSALMKNAGFADIKVIKDLAGLDRVVTGRKEVKNV